MADTIEIKQENWSEFFKTLHRLSGEQPVRVEVVGRDIGAQEMANALPLSELAFERAGSEKGSVVLAVDGPAAVLTHLIEKPTRLYAQTNAAGVVEVIEVEEEGGAKTLIFFEHLPEIAAETGAPA